MTTRAILAALLGILALVPVAGCVPEGAVRVQVFDEAAAAAFAQPLADVVERVGERLTTTVIERLPTSPAGTTDMWALGGSLAALYVGNQVRKWRLSRGNGVEK